jgi:ferredoxin-type protein NapH
MADIFKKTEVINFRKFKLPASVLVFTFLVLAIVQVKITDRPVIILERFVRGGGWLEITCISLYGSVVAFMMQDRSRVVRWRRLTWTLFSVVFFMQLILGVTFEQKFLMTGKLHLPVPAMILSGPVYRGQLSVMSILFLGTIILTGPAWCSHLCYFGAFDSIASKGKTGRQGVLNKRSIKATLLLSVIIVTMLLRWFKVSASVSTTIGISFGLTGLLVMVFFSRRKGKMIHCILYCPIGTIVNIMKSVNPFRLYIDSTCTLCMKCSSYCKYDALNPGDIKNKKPSFTCTLCGDCLAACNDNSIKYRFFSINPETARSIYLFLTISLHSMFLALARI